MATHSSILAWRIPWTEEPGGLTVHGVARELDTTSRLNFTTKPPSALPSSTSSFSLLLLLLSRFSRV